MKLFRRSYGKNLLMICLVASVLFSLLIVSVPAQPIVRLYVKMPPEGYISGKPVGTIFPIDINITSPPEWENTTLGIVGWAFNVKVNPAVLEPTTVRGAMSGYFLYDFIVEYGYYGHEPKLLYTLNKTEGLFSDVSEFIFGWNVTGVGAGGSGKLCTLMVKSLNQTAYSQIDITDAYYYTIAGKCRVDIVDDGYYNPPPQTIVHEAFAAGQTYYVVTESNSSVYNFFFNETYAADDWRGETSFNVTGTDGTIGFCNITIPKSLTMILPGDVWLILVDGAETTYGWSENATHTSLYFTYTQGSHKVQIYGTWVVPEFPTLMLPLLLMIATIAAAIASKKVWSIRRRQRL